MKITKASGTFKKSLGGLSGDIGGNTVWGKQPARCEQMGGA